MENRAPMPICTCFAGGLDSAFCLEPVLNSIQETPKQASETGQLAEVTSSQVANSPKQNVSRIYSDFTKGKMVGRVGFEPAAIGFKLRNHAAGHLTH